MEHVHSIIIIRKEDKFLNYFDKKWKIHLFPNIKGNSVEEIKEKYNTDNVKLLFDKVHEKYSIPHKEEKTYHHYFYEVEADVDGEYFSIEELLKDSKVKRYNEDIINYINNYYKTK